MRSIAEVIEDFSSDDGEETYTYRPLLLKALERTTGPVLELGMGWGSTPLLHDYCELRERKLVSFENVGGWFQRFVRLSSPGKHDLHLVKIWNEMYDFLPQERIGAALVDHCPQGRRWEEIARLRLLVDILVVHDTEPESEQHYGMASILSTFKNREDLTSTPDPNIFGAQHVIRTTMVSDVVTL